MLLSNPIIMQHLNIKHIVLTLGLLITAFWFGAIEKPMMDSKPVRIQEGTVQGTPKTNSIQASINGHYLTVVFTENLGNITVEVSKVNGGETQVESTPTPNGVNFYIYETGSYIVTFTLSNGDVYYGEFDVAD